MNVVERAKEIRKELKVNFPGVKFSVRTKKYSGGSSISVSWIDFPIVKSVEEIVNKYEEVSRCEYTGEILSGGNSFVFCSNTWSDEMKYNIKENIISKYGESFYNEEIQSWNLWRYEVEAFERLYDQSLIKVSDIVQNTKINEDIKVVLNEEKNGVELHFNTKPSKETRATLKENGFRWSKYNECWWATQNSDTLAFANSLVKEATPEIEEIAEEEKLDLITKANEDANLVFKGEIKILDCLDIEPIEEKATDKNIFIDCKIARKACDLEDVKNWEEDAKVVISKYIVFSNNDFDLLSNNLLTDCSAIAGYGGSRGFKNGIEVDYNSYKSISEFYNDKTIDVYCNSILITNEDNTKYIVVDPEGYNYCRYTGILETEIGKEILEQLKGNINNLKSRIKLLNNTLVKNNDNEFKQLESEFIALEMRLNMVSSKNLKYKIETQIQNKLQEIANYIKNDPILFDTFMNQYEK